ncbi:MAG: FAD-binding oxidoreductase, partial [Bryobacteraceae bacterium]
MIRPQSPQELAAALSEAAGRNHRITLGGAFSKNRMAGPILDSDVTVSTAAMTRVLHYEPRDLTISVEAGMRWADLTRLLAENRQMIPLDPPFAAEATAGGVVAANTSGPRRRLHGTARDLVIGMTFATLEGKLVQSGGMVVKNVAGLDMSKLLIGSFGTLGAIAVVNFKLLPIPPVERLFTLRFDSLAEAIAARDRILGSVLQPASLDLVNPAAAARLGLAGFALLLHAGGNAAVIDRYARELGATPEPPRLADLQEFTPRFLAQNTRGAVVRVSSTLSQVGEVVASTDAPVLSRAGNGVSYLYFDDVAAAAES